MFSFTIIFAGPLTFSETTNREALTYMDPISEPVEFGNLTLHLEHWLTLPATGDKRPKARLNHMIPSPDDSGRIFVNEMRGLLYSIKGNDFSIYLNARDYLPDFFSDRGLGGGLNFFTFHPSFSENGLIYTVHTEEPGDKQPDFIGPNHNDTNSIDSVLTEWNSKNPDSAIFEGTHRELMRVRFPWHIHNIQDIAFNPNAKPNDEDYGLLYVCIGEGGSWFRGIYNNINRLDSLLGTIVRIDPSGNNSSNGNYGVPESNPWAGDDNENTLGEIWALGFRNAHRLTWQIQGNKQLLATDIGERDVEEINIVEEGRNYGWPFREGTWEFQIDPNKLGLLPLPPDDSGYTYPVAQFDHKDGSAIIGGYIYHGSNHPLLKGKYLFGEVVLGHLFFAESAELELGKLAKIHKLRLNYEGKESTMQEIAGPGRVDLRFGIDHEGELYIMEKANGRIYKIISVTKKD